MAIENPDYFSRINVWGMLKGLANRNTFIVPWAGTPVDGTSGTFAGKAGPGTLILDYTNGRFYINAGTLLSPVWVSGGNPVVGNGGLGVVANAKMTYEFAVDGGAVSVITPSNSPTIPINAIILGGTIDITTTLTSGGAATIALGLGSGAQVASLKGATAVATWTAGQLALIPVFTAATYVKAAAATRLTLSVAAFALTAGKFDVNVAYVIGN